MMNLYTEMMLDQMRREDAQRSRTHAELEREAAAAKGRIRVTRTLNLEWLSRPFLSRSAQASVKSVRLKTT